MLTHLVINPILFETVDAPENDGRADLPRSLRNKDYVLFVWRLER